MKIIFDTNIILDVLAHREPFFEKSRAVMQFVAENKVKGAITANIVTDIFYVLRKHMDNETLKTALRNLMELFEVVEVSQIDCISALDLTIKDYEDSLLICCAKRWKADCIITRNIGDFKYSPVKAITPADFLKDNL